ncbi:MAG: hypothetical protein JRH20_17670, partial [Deltaproteobacteria bacterium]|nr:hypothetical protein [Deltaproteobacteria bacterium]
MPAIRRVLKAELKEPEAQSLDELGKVMLFSHRGSLHAENEDAALMAPIAPEVAVLLVADGMGGVKGGAAAARSV